MSVSQSAYLKNRTLKLSYLLLVMSRAFQPFDYLPYDSENTHSRGVGTLVRYGKS